jgi:hypothetical protein
MLRDSRVRGDAEAMFEYRSDPLMTRFQNWEPRSVEEIRTFIAGLAEIGIDTPGCWYQLGLFIRDSGELEGDCGIHVQARDPRQMEIGITLARAFQGRGLATEALKAVLDYLFMKLGKHRVPLILGAERKADADYLDACRIKRNTVEYQYVGGATDVDANELIEFAETLERDVLDWLKLRHPELAPK